MTAMNETSPQPVPRRRLGAHGPDVSAIGLGCMGMSEFYGAADETQSLSVLDHALDIGIDFLDTADGYGLGANERLLGRWLASRTRRDAVVIATKFGIVRTPEGQAAGINGRPEYVRACCEASLQRLGIDTIDLYYQHRVDTTVPIEETVGAMADLVREGKVRHLGMSEAGAGTLRRAAAVHPIAALQTEYSVWTRDVETNGVLDACRELGIGFVPYAPLGRGFLTGEIRSPDQLAADDWRRNNPRFQGRNFEINLALADELKAMAATMDCTPAQLAIAWLLGHGDDIVPIPGTRSAQRLDENAAATRITLDASLIGRLDELTARFEVQGDRYPASASGSASLNA